LEELDENQERDARDQVCNPVRVEKEKQKIEHYINEERSEAWRVSTSTRKMQRYVKKKEQDRQTKQAMHATFGRGRDFFARYRLEISHQATSISCRLDGLGARFHDRSRYHGEHQRPCYRSCGQNQPEMQYRILFGG
jgi:hypothetical protein